MSGHSPPPLLADEPSRDIAADLPSASVLRRLAALAYEGLLLAAVVLLAGFVLAPVVSPGSGAAANHALNIPALPARVLSFTTVFGVAGLYFCWCWTGGRRTLPLKTWRMRIVRDDGTALDARTAIVRYFALWIGPAMALLVYIVMLPLPAARFAVWLLLLNYAWALVDRERAFLHDRIARTRIVSDTRYAPPTAG